MPFSLEGASCLSLMRLVIISTVLLPKVPVVGLKAQRVRDQPNSKEDDDQRALEEPTRSVGWFRHSRSPSLLVSRYWPATAYHKFMGIYAAKSSLRDGTSLVTADTLWTQAPDQRLVASR
jgi:hypothetical protein